MTVVAKGAHEDVVCCTDLFAGSKETRPVSLRCRLPQPLLAQSETAGRPQAPAHLPDLAGIKQGKATQKDDESHHSSRHQHVGVPAKPGEIQSHLLAEVVPVGKLPPSRPPSPVASGPDRGGHMKRGWGGGAAGISVSGDSVT